MFCCSWAVQGEAGEKARLTDLASPGLSSESSQEPSSVISVHQVWDTLQ